MKNKQRNNASQLVLLRHGESVWNKENLFSGWSDVDLSDHGKEEVQKAGKILKEQGFKFDVAFTSVLKRAIRTLWIVLDEMDLMWIPVYRDWRLNERHYGALQGLNKSETTKKYGEEQVHEWRRSYDVRPPASKWKIRDIRPTIRTINFFFLNNSLPPNVLWILLHDSSRAGTIVLLWRYKAVGLS